MLFFFGEIIPQQLAIVLQKEDIGDSALPHAKVDGLVSLVVFNVVDGQELLRLPPVPEGDRAVHVVGEDVLAIYGGFCYSVLKTSYPLLTADADGLA